jgi:hypothetical protein
VSASGSFRSIKIASSPGTYMATDGSAVDTTGRPQAIPSSKALLAVVSRSGRSRRWACW